MAHVDDNEYYHIKTSSFWLISSTMDRVQKITSDHFNHFPITEMSPVCPLSIATFMKDVQMNCRYLSHLFESFQ